MLAVAVGGGSSIDRAGLAALIERLPGLSLVHLNANPPPDVLVWDAGGRGMEELALPPPGPAVLVLVSGEGIPVLPAGAAGLFSKDEPPEALAVAIRQVARGEAYLSTSLALALLQRHLENSPAEEAGASKSFREVLGSLTEREREVLALLAEGLPNKAIASRLYLSVRTVEGHLARLYPRLGVHSRTEAMRLVMENKSLFQSK